MSKKTKRSNKGRKSSSVNSSSSKRGRDEVTGLSVDYAGLTFKSDDIYDHQSHNGLSIFANDYFMEDGGGYIEFELSPRVIVITIVRNGGTNPAMQNSGKSSGYSRIVATGRFNYDKNGRFTDGKVSEVFQSTYYDGINTTIPDEYPNEWIVGIKVNLRGTDLHSLLTSDQRMPEIYDYDSGFGTQSTDTRDGLSRFASANFYEVGWWNNPLESNLI